MKYLKLEIVTADISMPFGIKKLKGNLEYKNREEIDPGEVYKAGDKKVLMIQQHR